MILDKSLNPCFNGICSARYFIFSYYKLSIVLILVLMEYALRGCHGSDIENQESAVLILVLMEYALREMNLLDVFGGYVTSLNPCFNGICSASARTTNSRGFEKAS